MNKIDIAFILFMAALIYLTVILPDITSHPAFKESPIIDIPPYNATSSHIMTIQNVYIDANGNTRCLYCKEMKP